MLVTAPRLMTLHLRLLFESGSPVHLGLPARVREPVAFGSPAPLVVKPNSYVLGISKPNAEGHSNDKQRKPYLTFQ